MFQEVKQFLTHAWWAFLAYAVATKYVIKEFYRRKFTKVKKLRLADYPKQHGRQAIVTGGSRGIGLEIVYNLLECGYSVIIGSSSTEEKRTELQISLQQKYPESDVKVWYLDLSSMKTVKKFAEKYLATEKPLHLLINNAGIMFVKECTTEDGYEKHFAVNYLSHSLLTILLLPLLSTSSTNKKHSRIINCTSCIHFVGNTDVIRFRDREFYSKYKAYIQSKLAQILFTYSLRTKLHNNKLNIDVNCAHPGVVNTDLMTSVLLFPKIGSLFLKTAPEGAETATFVALSEEMEGVSGRYLEDMSILSSSKVSYDSSLQEKLWLETVIELEPWINLNKYFFKLK